VHGQLGQFAQGVGISCTDTIKYYNGTVKKQTKKNMMSTGEGCSSLYIQGFCFFNLGNWFGMGTCIVVVIAVYCRARYCEW